MNSLEQRFSAWMAEHDPQDNPATPAATVLALRDSTHGPEVLMLQRNSKGTFASNWVFPGGKVDPEGFDGPGDAVQASARAARREALEEADLVLGEDTEMVPFSHWMPPIVVPRRFSTWFFAASAPAGTDGDVTIDGGEIVDHLWTRPEEALARHHDGDVELVPPTWITLHYLSGYSSTQDALAAIRQREPSFYVTRMLNGSPRAVAWHGDSAYESGEPDTSGGRHRLVMADDGWRFEHEPGHTV